MRICFGDATAVRLRAARMIDASPRENHSRFATTGPVSCSQGLFYNTKIWMESRYDFARTWPRSAQWVREGSKNSIFISFM